MKQKAVGLFSGGLDSQIATKLISELGFEVHALFFGLPWIIDYEKVKEAANRLGVKFVFHQLDEDYLEVVKNSRNGYGSAMNPCIDCKIYMLKKAANYMRDIGAAFVFTGEVLGQRPMSQKRHALKKIEQQAGLDGYLLRPLSARLLDATIPEKLNIIDREKLLEISGRGRTDQIALADKFGIKEYPGPAGGCKLTDQHYASRLKDLFSHGLNDYRETISIRWGRHYRIDDKTKVIVGRDEMENDLLIKYAKPSDYILEPTVVSGPTVILKGNEPCKEIIAMAAGFIQHFSKHRGADPIGVTFYQAQDKEQFFNTKAKGLHTSDIEKMKI
ncbi:MAG: tRNA 4-thiouridine(8) synthase ThiI [Candidatus Omnitrophica bacterium]|nr:tRNA 4-thiouridine(8) synthase ThiI [Candidatus Omnitrophota bacterium]